MPQLEWDELEFLECLEVVPEAEEYGTEYTYRVEEGQTLLLTVRPYESVIELSLFCANSDTSLISFALFVRGHARRRKLKGFEYLWLEDCVVASSRFRSTGINPFDHSQIAAGVDVEVVTKPRISVRLS